MDGINIIITRRKVSHKYKWDQLGVASFQNNSNHNGLDYLAVYNGKTYLKDFRCQTIANHPDPRYKYQDSLAPGKFQIKAFVDPRKFHGKPHGIINGTDLEGQPIGKDSMQLDNGYQSGRWLIHDKYSFDRRADTTYAWSGGCIILSSADLDALGTLLEVHHVKPGDILEAFLVEV